MAEKNIKSRIVLKHDVDANWKLATGFTPLKGEVIIYDIDSTHSYERIKIGDGVKNVNTLPFVDGALRIELLAQIGSVDDKVDAVSILIDDLIGGTKVSKQINDALEEATADDFGVFVQETEPTKAVAGDIWIDTTNDPSFIVPTIPEVTQADNGKVLMVVNGRYQLVNLNLSIDANGVVFM